MDAIRLQRANGKLMANLGDEGKPVAVCLVYARPLSAREGEIAIMDEAKKKELFMLSSLDELDPDSRKAANEDLFSRYRICEILTIHEGYVDHGHRYLKVSTDRGERYFNLREPGKNVTHLTDDHLVIQDSMGNRYEIPSIKALDLGSRSHLERVL